MDWLHNPKFELPGEDYGYRTFYDSIDTTLMGNNTYKQVLGFDVPFPYPDKKNYVFTRDSGKTKDENVEFVSTDIVKFVGELKAKKGKDIWLVGGGQINLALLHNNMIDKIILTLIPVVLGAGIPLFGNESGEWMFELKSSQSYKSGMVQLSYSRE